MQALIETRGIRNGVRRLKQGAAAKKKIQPTLQNTMNELAILSVTLPDSMVLAKRGKIFGVNCHLTVVVQSLFMTDYSTIMKIRKVRLIAFPTSLCVVSRGCDSLPGRDKNRNERVHSACI